MRGGNNCGQIAMSADLMMTAVTHRHCLGRLRSVLGSAHVHPIMVAGHRIIGTSAGAMIPIIVSNFD
jgi:hypothetical protein